MKYPWLNDYREKAVTELEFLHGHLRNPGKRAACFFFRDKVKTYIDIPDILQICNYPTYGLSLFGFKERVCDVSSIMTTRIKKDSGAGGVLTLIINILVLRRYEIELS